jgi:hypothetical protein
MPYDQDSHTAVFNGRKNRMKSKLLLEWALEARVQRKIEQT